MRTSSPQATARDPRHATSMETLRATMAAEPGDPSARAWRRLNLVYLIFVFLPLVWVREDLPLAVGVTLLALAVFLPIYWKSFLFDGRKGLVAGLAMAATGFALTPWNPGGNTLLVYAFASLGFSQRWRVAVGVAAALLAAYGAWLWALSMPMPFIVAPGLIGSAVLAGAILGKREMQRNERLRLTQAEVDRLARVAERERIARDLHDLLGHTLTAVAVKADLAGRLLDADPARARAEIEDIRRTARSALADVRAAVTGMRSTRLAHELASARRALDSAGIAFSVQGVPPALPEPVETALAFVLLEGVTNVVRHAQAKQCRVDFGLADGAVTLLVRDSPQAAEALPTAAGASTPALPTTAPAAARPAEGHGITGMRQRLAAVGGTLALQFGPEGGVLLARVPLPAGTVAGAAG